MTQKDGRLGIGVIWAGRVGPVLAAALAGAGHAIVGISAHSEDARTVKSAASTRAWYLSMAQGGSKSEG